MNWWTERQRRDPYVQQARQAGWRSRAYFKLEQLDRKHRVFQPGQRVLDLGAAPGSWSQYAVQRIGRKGRVVGVDLLPIQPLDQAEFLQADFLEPASQDWLRTTLGGAADVLLSDLSPNKTGSRLVDQLRFYGLAETVLEFSTALMAERGVLVIKVFQGVGFDEFVAAVKSRYAKVTVMKPEASRAESRESYLIARDRRARPGDAAQTDVSDEE